VLGLHKLVRRSDVGFVIGACFFVRRSVFEQVGGFDARYWLYGEETDLCARISVNGGEIRVSKDLWAEHAGGASRDTAPALVAEHFERGGERFVADREGIRGLVSYRLAKAVGSVVRSLAPGSESRRKLHRARLKRYARTLVLSPTRVALDSPATRAPGHSVVVCSLEAWDDVWRRNQFLVQELLATDPHLRVLFVEPSFDWVHELRRSSGTRTRRRGLRSVRGDGRVLAFEPCKVTPRVLGPFANRSLVRQVLATVNQLGFDRPTLWINDTDFVGLLRTRWPAVYDITDDWLLASAPRRTLGRLERAERWLMRDAGGVVVCSPALAESRRAQRRDLSLIPNAVDYEHFTRKRPRPDDLPKGSVAVYVGTLHEDRVDVELVDALAQAVPDLGVVLVGPSSLGSSSTERLAARPNVHLLGPRAYEDVPAYLQHADVVIVPHVVSPFTESLDPIKAYECLAVGRATVATPVAGFRDLGGPVVVADADEFIVAVEAALAATAQLAPSMPPSWADRADLFASVLQCARDTAVAP
jgi:glycosyltransferase involved in cell wall biosynthesis